MQLRFYSLWVFVAFCASCDNSLDVMQTTTGQTSTGTTVSQTTSTSVTGGTSSTSSPTTSTVPLPPCVAGADIELAVASATSGDTIYICPGVHAVNLILDDNLTLSAQDITKLTVLDGSGLGPVVTANSNGRLELLDLVLTNGDGGAAGGGGVMASDALQLTLKGCTVEGNVGFIGGVYGPMNDRTVVTSSVIRDNQGEWAGGIGLGDGDLDQVEISGNTSEQNNGGVWVYPFQGPTVGDVTVSGNTAVGNGGGVGIDFGSTWLGGVVEGNTAANGGGVAFLNTSGAALVETDVIGNTATVSGGGVYNAETIGGDFFVIDTLLEGNYAPVGGGFSVQRSLDGAAALTLTRVDMTGNSAEEGAGLYIDGIAVAFEQGSLVSNAATVSGGGARLIGGSSLEIVGVDLGGVGTENTPDDVDLDGVSYDYDGTITVSCSSACQ